MAHHDIHTPPGRADTSQVHFCSSCMLFPFQENCSQGNTGQHNHVAVYVGLIDFNSLKNDAFYLFGHKDQQGVCGSEWGGRMLGKSLKLEVTGVTMTSKMTAHLAGELHQQRSYFHWTRNAEP